jgi:hypothetical protein
MRVVETYFRLLGATLVALVLADLRNEMWGLQTGRLFPYRHVGIVPLYGPVGLIVEWAALLVGAAGLSLGVRRRDAVWLAAATMLASLTQHYSNHGALTFMVLLFTALRVPKTGTDLLAPNMLLVRWQLAIVYVFSALNKVIAGWAGGRTMANLYLALRDPIVPREWFAPLFRPPGVVVFSLAIVAVELAIPLVLSRRPRAGIAMVVALHGGITLLMPGLLPFSFVMLAMSVLYLVPLPAGDESGPASVDGYGIGSDAMPKRC